jgi:hypothetical protein
VNPYDIGIGSIIVTALEVIIIAFLWGSLATLLAGSASPQAQKVGTAMGAIWNP